MEFFCTIFFYLIICSFLVPKRTKRHRGNVTLHRELGLYMHQAVRNGKNVQATQWVPGPRNALKDGEWEKEFSLCFFYLVFLYVLFCYRFFFSAKKNQKTPGKRTVSSCSWRKTNTWMQRHAARTPQRFKGRGFMVTIVSTQYILGCNVTLLVAGATPILGCSVTLPSRCRHATIALYYILPWF